METYNFEGLPTVVGSKKASPFMGEVAAERPEGVTPHRVQNPPATGFHPAALPPLTRGAWVLECPGPAPKAPLAKGGCHGAAVTGGFQFIENIPVDGIPLLFLQSGAAWGRPQPTTKPK